MRLLKSEKSKGIMKDLGISILVITWIASIANWALIIFVLPVGVSKILITILLLLTWIPTFFFVHFFYLNSSSVPDQCKHTKKRSKLIGSCLIACAMSFMTIILSCIVGLIAQHISQNRFQTQRNEFLKDPNGFLKLKNLAMKDYKTLVVLGDSADSWALTSIAVPNASPASMSSEAGYCKLNFSKENVVRMSYDKKIDSNIWVQGVMMHELAHCLDRSRDLPNEYGLMHKNILSLAPEVAKNVKDLETYLKAEEAPETGLWREALADIFAAGYWKLNHPQEAQKLIIGLSTYRESNKTTDPGHATQCWLNSIITTTPPEQHADLFIWADQIRKNSNCKLKET